MRERLLAAEKVKAIEWRNGTLYLLDQRLLPLREVWQEYVTAADVVRAIVERVVCGEAAIGIAAAYALVLAARDAQVEGRGEWLPALDEDLRRLSAVCSAAWVIERMRDRLQRCAVDDDAVALLEAEALSIHASDREASLAMAQFGMEQIRRHQGNSQNLLTHGNSGALAGGGFGAALGVIRAAHLEGLVECVYVDETRPWLQGSRLTAWELMVDDVPVILNSDSAAAHLMKSRGVTWVIVGAERIAANGDVASRTGTYQLSVCAMHHGVRFMVVAPSSVIDMSLETGEDMLIEECAADELLEVVGHRVAAGVPVFNPAFDVTPADLIDVIVTEKGVVERPDAAKLEQLMSRKRLH
ncbi:S-methyl-5-thioribose-1-phosphate isomerase [Pseudomonas sp. LRF_L74]|uniref:S-methyl-5-thioribose-1-phosphate isomerase n=1 Tax=Pseudomonas sp. LRF_L74 TaxID=3369422 RepID=UPI003F60C614